MRTKSAPEKTIEASDEELLARAMRAYFVRARKEGFIVDYPATDSGVEWCGDKAYVVLRNVRGILDIYRVRNDGMLKHLRRHPKGLDL